jgi:methionine-rich copper-binding protein CopC
MRTRPRSRTTHPFALGIGALLALSLTLVAGPAQAHDELVSTNPADKAQVQAMPDEIVLTFEEPAEKVGSQVIVRGPNGNIAQGPPVFAKSTVTQAVRPGAPAGSYTVLWRVTSDDGHPVSGSFTFTTASAAVDPAASASPTTSPTASAGSTAGADPSSASQQSSGNDSKAPRWLWLLVLLALLVPVGIFVRRRPGGPHDASPM